MQTKPEKITILMADDYPIVREGFHRILSNITDMSIVGEAQDGCEVKELVSKIRPRILLLDLKMPETCPVETGKWVREKCPETTTLALTGPDHDCYLARMIDAGIAGYLCKNEKAETLISAIRRAACGEILFTTEQIDRAIKWRHEVGERWERLTEREREILLLVARGLTNKTIAEKLTIMPKTVAYHISAILCRLEVTSRNEAAVWLHKHFPEIFE